MSRPLEGVRVLDLSRVLAGPWATQLLADLGADVIKVENPGAGDDTRHWGPPWLEHGDQKVAAYFLAANRGKRSVAIDFATEEGAALVRRMAADADVLVENFKVGGLRKFGLDADSLRAEHPRLIYASITGFGQDGPYAGRPGFATIAEAMSGFAAINGEPDGGPLLPPIALTDEVTALAAAFATMTALWSGVGQVVDVNLLESLFQCMGPLPGAYGTSGYLQPRLGSGIPYSVPRGTWRCADGRWIAVSTSAESVAARVMELLGFGDRDDLATVNGRIAARDEIDARMAEWCGARTQAEVLAEFEAAHAAAAPVYDMADIASAMVANPGRPA